ncbi:MAG: hypothetical protein L0Y58_04660 [Verrucomicrobia subdivision 3 bacterium]|nr:hypothetical protein [Limisphaerales bacterium]
MRIVVAGTVGRSGLGGQAWASLQYLLGFRALGHDVFYLEDCGQSSWVYNWDTNEWTTELDYPAAYVNACLKPFGLGEDWIYRTDEGSRGASLDRFIKFCETSDVILIRAVPLWVWRKEYSAPKRRAFIDVDPGFTQISIANGDKGLGEAIARCERRFTVGQNVGAVECPIPAAGGPWLKTLPTVFLPEWPFASGDASHFTSVMRWQGFKEVMFGGISYGQRDVQFPKFQDLPRRTRQPFRLAQMGVNPKLLEAHGWEVVSGEIVSKTPQTYREFIQQSRGEICIPKGGYVEMRGGWLSDRSVCYLASGRPVVMADTGGFHSSTGLILFADLESAAAAVEEVNAEYEEHRRAARRLAEECFSTEKVLPRLLEEILN